MLLFVTLAAPLVRGGKEREEGKRKGARGYGGVVGGRMSTLVLVSIATTENPPTPNESHLKAPTDSVL